ncbi:Predicted dithiol-disulfide isomerase, DsbA family [Nannocystis exedens]|uniref:Predicted dithiol-disulfide isomerase, DsbA family n=1 Tax=Nannocystis exedens TaxID=54 RepID=A0A1I1TJS5_9BACT|nr:DsbA family oxidoreductase [Nannocystis exedens]PCC66516.1 DSBA-like thioredoxin domain protein [Nannocystis exedens]SFD58785.1 Predicted dithiol-disulfide isomerase, DsbA family [Nannocystis exedens]
MHIDIVSDIACPWCFIGIERLERALAETKAEATVTLHPYLLDPDGPDSGTDIRARLRQKFGGDPTPAFANVERAARETGIPLDFEKVRMGYPTLRAHTLLRHAQTRGTQRALSRALFAAYFLEAKNIADPAVLAEIAAPHGFTAEEVAKLTSDTEELARTRQEADHAARSGVRGVPLFIFDGRSAISGAQPEAVFREAIRKAAG